MPSTELDEILAPQAIGRFADAARRAVYDVIALRRDVRHFAPGAEVDDATLERILDAAHHAPSVGFSQPWGFVILRDRAQRERIRRSFLACRASEAVRFPPERRGQYLAYRLEGILESALNLCVAVDLRPRPEAILGTTVQPEAVRWSACCAVQNLWLAARAEGVGIGWVSIVEPAVLRQELMLPPGVEPIAYLCVGQPQAFRSRPMLEEVRWLPRRPLAEVIHPGGVWRAEAQDEPTTAACADASGSRRTEKRGVPAFGSAARAASLAHQASLTKPVGSLGRLEEIAAWYAGARGKFPLAVPGRATLAIFAADHGVVAEGVSAYSSQLTAAMVCNIMAGGGAVNALAARYAVDLELIDAGVAGDLSLAPREPLVELVRARLGAGTRNFRREPAMDRAAAEAAVALGERVAADLAGRVDIVAAGEVGIGNTTAAAAVVCALTGARAVEVVGRGTGVDDATLARKRAVVAESLALHRPHPDDPLGVISAVGGFELAAMAGFMRGAAAHRLPVVLDGFLAVAAALLARALDPAVSPYLLASHVSSEPGARLALGALGLTPLLDLGLRLGEGTGAILAIDLVRTAVATQLAMATFATAGVVGRAGTMVAVETES
jgi:nicotinate-nucleotide--dimethylbenzimidazole phosphoribosyltransferase